MNLDTKNVDIVDAVDLDTETPAERDARFERDAMPLIDCTAPPCA